MRAASPCFGIAESWAWLQYVVAWIKQVSHPFEEIRWLDLCSATVNEQFNTRNETGVI